MNFGIQRIYRSKALAFSVVSLIIAALTGLALVLLGHGNYHMMIIAALLFFLAVGSTLLVADLYTFSIKELIRTPKSHRKR
jgi:hypothetical protein